MGTNLSSGHKLPGLRLQMRHGASCVKGVKSDECERDAVGEGAEG